MRAYNSQRQLDQWHHEIEWYISMDGQRCGPMSYKELKSRIHAAQLEAHNSAISLDASTYYQALWNYAEPRDIRVWSRMYNWTKPVNVGGLSTSPNFFWDLYKEVHAQSVPGPIPSNFVPRRRYNFFVDNEVGQGVVFLFVIWVLWKLIF